MSMTLASDKEIPASVVAEWEGTVLWRSTKNPYRPGHKRSNWFVGVHFIDELELPEISETDIVYSSCRSGGKGGQNVNKVETTVRATHVPTGISVRCSEERSQAQNKARARERLLLKLLNMQETVNNSAKSAKWSLAPAYDITYSPAGTRGEHSTSVKYAGNPAREDIISAGTGIRISRKICIDILEEITAVCETELEQDKLIKL